MKAYYLEDKIEETKDPLKAKIIKIVHDKAAHEVNRQLKGHKFTAITVQPVDKVYEDLWDIYDLPFKKLHHEIISLTFTAIEILDREIETSIDLYKKFGIYIDDNDKFFIALITSSRPEEKISDDELCVRFNKRIDEICKIIKNSKKEDD